MSYDDDFMGGASPTEVKSSITSISYAERQELAEKQKFFLTLLEVDGLLKSPTSKYPSVAIETTSSKNAKKIALTNKYAYRDVYVFLIDFAGIDVEAKLITLINSLPLAESRFVLCFRFSEQVEPCVLPHVFSRNTTNVTVLQSWFSTNKFHLQSISKIADEKLGDYMSRFTVFFDYANFIPSGCSCVFKHVI